MMTNVDALFFLSGLRMLSSLLMLLRLYVFQCFFERHENKYG